MSIEKVLVFSTIGVIILGSLYLKFLKEKIKETPIGKAILLPISLVFLALFFLFQYSQWGKFNEEAKKMAQYLSSIKYESVTAEEKEAFINFSKKSMSTDVTSFMGRSRHHGRKRRAQHYLEQLEQATVDSKITQDEIKVLMATEA